jgi:mRNA-degrading endonuclease RelE of RelBE toxin-antitoxin system
MAARKVERTSRFDRDLTQLAKKDRGFRKIVGDFLKERANGVPFSGKDRMPNVEGKPVYKARLPFRGKGKPFRGKGKRHGARIIYHCDSSGILALRIFDKSTIKEPPANDLKQALLSAGL